jgi:hypothetical protein
MTSFEDIITNEVFIDILKYLTTLNWICMMKVSKRCYMQTVFAIKNFRCGGCEDQAHYIDDIPEMISWSPYICIRCNLHICECVRYRVFCDKCHNHRLKRTSYLSYPPIYPLLYSELDTH